MFEATQADFPYVDELPKREQKRVLGVWDRISMMNDVWQEHGGLVPVIVAAKCLNVSRSRLDDFAREGRLVRVELEGHVYVSRNSLTEFARIERANGRPVKTTGQHVKEFVKDR
jgi:hypothetical protein